MALGKRSKAQVLLVGSWLAAAVLVTGCVAGDVSIEPERRSTVRSIAVHPMEPPPLVVPTSFTAASELVREWSYLEVLGVLVGGVLFLTRSEELSQEAKLWESHAQLLEAEQVWQPTLVVARQVEASLKGKKPYEVHLHVSMTKLFSGEKRGRFDPYGPVRAWFNGDEATERARKSDVDVVVEVGVLNYELAQGLFLIAVVLRAVDPVTGEVLARARAYATPHALPMVELFEDEAQAFKAMFTSTTKQLAEQALNQLGL